MRQSLSLLFFSAFVREKKSPRDVGPLTRTSPLFFHLPRRESHKKRPLSFEKGTKKNDELFFHFCFSSLASNDAFLRVGP